MYITTIKAEIVGEAGYGYVVRYTSIHRNGHNFHTCTEIGDRWMTREQAEAELRYHMG